MAYGWWALGVSIVSAFAAEERGQAAASMAEEQANQQRLALQAQQRASNVEAQKVRIQQVREARIARARLLAQSANTGMGAGTSGLSGATASITSQEASNIGSINQAQSFAEIASNANMRIASLSGSIARVQSQGAAWQSIGSISGSIFQAKGGWNNIFSPSIKKAEAQTPTSNVGTN